MPAYQGVADKPTFDRTGEVGSSPVRQLAARQTVGRVEQQRFRVTREQHRRVDTLGRVATRQRRDLGVREARKVDDVRLGRRAEPADVQPGDARESREGRPRGGDERGAIVHHPATIGYDTPGATQQRNAKCDCRERAQEGGRPVDAAARKDRSQGQARNDGHHQAGERHPVAADHDDRANVSDCRDRNRQGDR